MKMMVYSIPLVDAWFSWPIIAIFSMIMALGILFSILSASHIGAWRGFITGVVSCTLCILFSLAAIPASASMVEHENMKVFSRTYPSIIINADVDSILADPKPGDHAMTRGYDGVYDMFVSDGDDGLRLTVDPAR